MNYEAHKATLLAHYVDMARIPGAKHYAWARVNELAKECPELYAELPDKLKEAMRAGTDPAIPADREHLLPQHGRQSAD